MSKEVHLCREDAQRTWQHYEVCSFRTYEWIDIETQTDRQRHYSTHVSSYRNVVREDRSNEDMFVPESNTPEASLPSLIPVLP